MSLLKLAPFHTFKEYKFKDPDTGIMHTGISFPDLISRVRLYRSQNQLEDLPFLESVVEHWLCVQPDNSGACEKRPPLKRGILPTLKGGVLILKQMLYNSFADQIVADSRSEICKDCSLNSFPDMGPFIEWCNEIAEMSVGDRKSKYHDSLGVCDGCKCPLRSKVFYAGKIKLSDEEQKVMGASNPACWQLKEIK